MVEVSAQERYSLNGDDHVIAVTLRKRVMIYESSR